MTNVKQSDSKMSVSYGTSTKKLFVEGDKSAFVGKNCEYF